MTEHVISLGCVNIEKKKKAKSQHSILLVQSPRLLLKDASTVPSWQEKVMVTWNQLKNKIEF